MKGKKGKPHLSQLEQHLSYCLACIALPSRSDEEIQPVHHQNHPRSACLRPHLVHRGAEGFCYVGDF